MLQAYVTPPLLALVAAVHLANLAACIAVICSAPSRSAGWKNIEPSWMHWGAFFGGWAFTGLLTWWWLFVGTALPDPEEQMWAAFLLVIVLGSLSAVCSFHLAYLRRTSLQWRGMMIRQREGRKEVLYDIAQFISFQHSWDGSLSLHFRNGKCLKLDINARNAGEFIGAVYGRATRQTYRTWRPSSSANLPRRWPQLPAFRFNTTTIFREMVLPILEDYWRAEDVLRFESRDQPGSEKHHIAKYVAFRYASIAVMALHRFAEIVANHPPRKLRRFKGDSDGVRKWMGNLIEESHFVDEIAKALTKARSENKKPVHVYREGRIMTVGQAPRSGRYSDEEYDGDTVLVVAHAERPPLAALLAPIAQTWIRELDISFGEPRAP